MESDIAPFVLKLPLDGLLSDSDAFVWVDFLDVAKAIHFQQRSVVLNNSPDV